MQTYAKVVEPGERLTEKILIKLEYFKLFDFGQVFSKEGIIIFDKEMFYWYHKRNEKRSKLKYLPHSHLPLGICRDGLEWADGAKPFSKQKLTKNFTKKKTKVKKVKYFRHFRLASGICRGGRGGRMRSRGSCSRSSQPRWESEENKPENQDEDALGKIEQQQDFVILELGASIKVGVHL